MPTRGNGVGTAVHEVAEHASALARLEAELATLELRGKLRSLGVGGGLLVAAAILGLYSLGFSLAAVASGLASVVDIWLALAIVALGLLAGTFAFAMAGIASLRRGVPPVPERAMAEAKLTAEALKGNGCR
jgi:Putative Actinobacterial Holin-X, holin superfamily III